MKRLFSTLIALTLLIALLSVLFPEQATSVKDMLQGGSAGSVRSQQGSVEPVATIGTEDIDDTFERLLYENKSSGTRLAIADIIDETNKERIKAGLVPLRANALLVDSAKLKTDDMIALQYFEHTSPSGKSVSDLGKDVGYDYIVMGENLAMGDFKNARDLVDAWMNSPGHRANILNEAYQDIGVYAGQGTFEGQPVWFAVQHFGTGRSVCPTISTTLRKEIETANHELDKQQKTIEELKAELEGMSVDNRGYDDKVNLFNAMVTAYNKALDSSKIKIAQYNKQVSLFNTCLVQYQE